MDWTSKWRTAAKLLGLERYDSVENVRDGQKEVGIPQMMSSKRVTSGGTLESLVMMMMILEEHPDTVKLLDLGKSS